jgi:hypothetical protein
MKKFLILTSAILLVAAACNKQAAVQPAPTPTPNPTPTPTSQIYTNSQYGFTIDLQPDWTGYTVLSQQWENNNSKQTGPKIVLRHPKWTVNNHYEDIPVDIFTTDQWNRVLKGTLLIGAGPVSPSELDHNSIYVFALPARYNFDEATGWQEADQMVHTLKSFEVQQSAANTFEIAALGLKFQAPPSLSDLDYRTIKLSGDQSVSSVEFSSKKLETAGCDIAKAPLGYLTYDNDKGGTLVANARSSNLYYIAPKTVCGTSASDSDTLKSALKSLTSDNSN